GPRTSIHRPRPTTLPERSWGRFTESAARRPGRRLRAPLPAVVACAEISGAEGSFPGRTPEDAAPLQHPRERAVPGIVLIDLAMLHAHDTEPAGWERGKARGAVRESCGGVPGFV